MPEGMTPPVPATLIASSGRHRLWVVATSGYLQVVDTSGIVEADRSDMATQMQPFLQSAAFRQGELATVAFNGGAAAPPTLPISASPTSPPGTSVDTVEDGQGRYVCGDRHRESNRRGGAQGDIRSGLARHRRRRAATPYMVVPGFVAVTVGPGQHTVVFRYVSYRALSVAARHRGADAVGARVDAVVLAEGRLTAPDPSWRHLASRAAQHRSPLAVTMHRATSGEGTSDVLVVIPAFNEECNVASVVTEVRREGFAALVVDDGSTDRTAEIAAIGGRRRAAPSRQSRGRRRAPLRVPVCRGQRFRDRRAVRCRRTA